MRSLLSTFSMRTASIASRTLRAMLSELSSSMFLATCCVILGGDEGLLDHVRDRGERHEDAPLGRQFRHQRRIAREDAAHDAWLIALQAVHIRQVGGVMAVEHERAGRAYQHQRADDRGDGAD